MALVVEERKLVHVAGGDPELGSHRVEIDRAALRAVDAAEIEGELSVEKDEDVVVAGEAEFLAP
jgi:hypothetical protein